MAEEYVRGADVYQASRTEEASEWEHGREASETDYQEEAGLARSLLGEGRLGGRGNGSVRAATMLGMQQTHGNRAVQRLMTARNQALPVQRDDEDPKKPSFRPWLPKLTLPFGGGWSFSGEGKGVGINYKGGSASGGIGYDYDGAVTAEGGWKLPSIGKGSVGVEYNPSKQEGSAGIKLGDFHMKGQYGPKGWGMGIGYGFPFLTPPGIGINPADPSKDWRKGDIGPGMFDPPDKIEKQKPGWGVGVGFGQYKNPDPNNPIPMPWQVFGGIQGVF